MSSPADGRADALRAGLATLGVHARVDADGSLAVLRLDAEPSSLATMREKVVALARECGFTHVALELPPNDADHADVRGAESRA